MSVCQEVKLLQLLQDRVIWHPMKLLTGWREEKTHKERAEMLLQGALLLKETILVLLMEELEVLSYMAQPWLLARLVQVFIRIIRNMEWKSIPKFWLQIRHQYRQMILNMEISKPQKIQDKERKIMKVTNCQRQVLPKISTTCLRGWLPIKEQAVMLHQTKELIIIIQALLAMLFLHLIKLNQLVVVAPKAFDTTNQNSRT